MKKDKRTNREVLCCIEQKQIQQGRDVFSLKSHFENHLTEHKEVLKDKLQYNLSKVSGLDRCSRCGGKFNRRFAFTFCEIRWLYQRQN